MPIPIIRGTRYARRILREKLEETRDRVRAIRANAPKVSGRYQTVQNGFTEAERDRLLGAEEALLFVNGGAGRLFSEWLERAESRIYASHNHGNRKVLCDCGVCLRIRGISKPVQTDDK